METTKLKLEEIKFDEFSSFSTIYIKGDTETIKEILVYVSKINTGKN